MVTTFVRSAGRWFGNSWETASQTRHRRKAGGIGAPILEKNIFILFDTGLNICSPFFL